MACAFMHLIVSFAQKFQLSIYRSDRNGDRPPAHCMVGAQYLIDRSDNMVTDVHVHIDKGQERRGMNGEGRGEVGMILLHTNR